MHASNGPNNPTTNRSNSSDFLIADGLSVTDMTPYEYVQHVSVVGLALQEHDAVSWRQDVPGFSAGCAISYHVYTSRARSDVPRSFLSLTSPSWSVARCAIRESTLSFARFMMVCRLLFLSCLLRFMMVPSKLCSTIGGIERR